MNAILDTAIPARRSSAARLDRNPAVCGCGQDLDVCTGAHCPRCGIQVGSARFEPAGFWHAA
jgi:predicted amidophosphoribosyltransferase